VGPGTTDRSLPRMTTFIHITAAIGFLTCQVLLVRTGAAVLAEVARLVRLRRP
jgi:hypothetical protein